jgi:hypothetical protein
MFLWNKRNLLTTDCTTALTHQQDIVLIAAEHINVPLHPLKRKYLIPETVVSRQNTIARAEKSYREKLLCNF